MGHPRTQSKVYFYLPLYLSFYIQKSWRVLAYYLTNSPLSLSHSLGCYFFLSLKLFSTLQFNTHFCVFLLSLIAASLFVSFSSFFFSKYWVCGRQCLREHRLEKIKASTLQVTNPKGEQPPANEYQNLHLRGTKY